MLNCNKILFKPNVIPVNIFSHTFQNEYQDWIGRQCLGHRFYGSQQADINNTMDDDT